MPQCELTHLKLSEFDQQIWCQAPLRNLYYGVLSSEAGAGFGLVYWGLTPQQQTGRGFERFLIGNQRNFCAYVARETGFLACARTYNWLVA